MSLLLSVIENFFLTPFKPEKETTSDENFNPLNDKNKAPVKTTFTKILNKLTNFLHQALKFVRRFSELVPGFNRLPHNDQELLIYSHGMDLVCFRVAWR